jgi:hypothetical protein
MNVELLRAYNDMFEGAGWKALLSEAGEELHLIKEQLFYNVTTMEEVAALRGQAFQLNKLLTLEDSLINMVQQEQSDQEEEDYNADL